MLSRLAVGEPAQQLDKTAGTAQTLFLARLRLLAVAVAVTRVATGGMAVPAVVLVGQVPEGPRLRHKVIQVASVVVVPA